MQKENLKKDLKYFLMFNLLLILFFFVLLWGIARADRICSEANDNWEDYRFCMGI